MKQDNIPLIIRYNKCSTLIKSILFFVVGCLMLKVTSEAIMREGVEISFISIFIPLSCCVFGIWFIERGLLYDHIYCRLFEYTTNMGTLDFVVGATILVSCMLLLFGHLISYPFLLGFSLFSNIVLKIQYICYNCYN